MATFVRKKVSELLAWHPAVHDVPSMTGIQVKLGRRVDRIFCIKFHKPQNATLDITANNPVKLMPLHMPITPYARHCLQAASRRRLTVAGELDKASGGVVLLTNSPGLLNTASTSGIVSTYKLRVDPVPSDAELEQLREQIELHTSPSAALQDADEDTYEDANEDGGLASADVEANKGGSLASGNTLVAATSDARLCRVERPADEKLWSRGVFEITLPECSGGRIPIIRKLVRSVLKKKKFLWCHRTVYGGISLDGIVNIGHARELSWEEIGPLLDAHGGGDEAVRAEGRPPKRHWKAWDKRKPSVRKSIRMPPKIRAKEASAAA